MTVVLAPMEKEDVLMKSSVNVRRFTARVWRFKQNRGMENSWMDPSS